LRPHTGLVALAFAATAWAAPPTGTTPGHPATAAPGAAAPTRGSPANPSALRPVALVNAGFESGTTAPTEDPDGWFFYQHAGATSYLFVLDEAVRRGGARSLRIDNVGVEPYGSVAQIVAGRELSGKTVRFSAWLKTRGADDRGATLFIIAMRGGYIAAYNFMAGAAVKGTRDWARHTLTLAIPAQAEQVQVGATLEGEGTVWIDDARLEVMTTP
jgi:hypothetical protein